MLAYTVHDVKISCGIRELPPEDGWRRFESTGVVTLACSYGHRDGPMPKALARLTAELHIHGIA
jgi:hypothetical protein